MLGARLGRLGVCSVAAPGRSCRRESLNTDNWCIAGVGSASTLQHAAADCAAPQVLRIATELLSVLKYLGSLRPPGARRGARLRSASGMAGSTAPMHAAGAVWRSQAAGGMYCVRRPYW